MTEIEERIEGIIKDKLEQGISIGGNTVQITSDTVLFPSGSNSNHMKIYKDYIQYPDGSQQESNAPKLTELDTLYASTVNSVGISWAYDIKDFKLGSYAYWDSLTGYVQFDWDTEYRINAYRHHEYCYGDPFEWKLQSYDGDTWSDWVTSIPSSCGVWSDWAITDTVVTSSLRLYIDYNPTNDNLTCNEFHFKYSSQ